MSQETFTIRLTPEQAKTLRDYAAWCRDTEGWALQDAITWGLEHQREQLEADYYGQEPATFEIVALDLEHIENGWRVGVYFIFPPPHSEQLAATVEVRRDATYSVTRENYLPDTVTDCELLAIAADYIERQRHESIDRQTRKQSA